MKNRISIIDCKGFHQSDKSLTANSSAGRCSEELEAVDELVRIQVEEICMVVSCARAKANGKG